MNSPDDRTFYIRRIATITAALDTVEQDLETAQTTEKENKLNARAEQLMQSRRELQDKLSQFDLAGNNSNSKMIALDDCLRKIDFEEARELAAKLKQRFKDEDHGAALMLLERTTNRMGHYCLDEMLSEIFGCNVECFKPDIAYDSGSYRTYEVDLSDVASGETPISTFLERMADYHKSVDIQDDKTFRTTFCESLRSGDRVLILVKNWQHATDAVGFTSWFLHDFWRNLVSQIQQSVLPKYGRIKVIAVLFAGSGVPQDCRKSLSLEPIAQFSPYFPIEVPLPAQWTDKDVGDWLMDVRKMDRELSEVKANQILKETEGLPTSICTYLKEKYSA
jgi:hypothetical protein